LPLFGVQSSGRQFHQPLCGRPHLHTLRVKGVRRSLIEALADSPAALVHGPRQCGKTTLARAVGDAAGYACLSFDDGVLRASAQTDAMGFVANLPDKVV